MYVLCAGLPSSLSLQQSSLSISSSSEQVYQRPVKYVPDFGVRAVTNVVYLRIRRSHYIAARRATLLERAPKKQQALDNAEDLFDKEWQRAISVDPDHMQTTSEVDGDIKMSLSRENLVPDGHRGARTRSETQDSLDYDRCADAGTPLMISSCETMPETKNEAKS